MPGQGLQGQRLEVTKVECLPADERSWALSCWLKLPVLKKRGDSTARARPEGMCSVGVQGHLPLMSDPAPEARRHPRFKCEIDICVYPRNSAVVRGHTVDLSESGISAMLRTEIPVGEVVRLEFTLPL